VDGELRLASWQGGVARAAGPPGDDLLARLRVVLAEDLDTPSALAAVDAWCAVEGADRDAPTLVRDAVDALLGVAL
jgi:L-cysteine:1D-myo-inositol 2-amino-2-deoxy-alpha-D-glucopyranoside ligase